MCHRSWVHGLAQTRRGPHRERGLLQTSDSSDEDVTPRLPPFRDGRLTAGGLAPKEADGSAHLLPGRSCRVRCIARVADAHSLVGIWCTTIGRAAAKSTLGSFVLSVRCVSVPRHAGRARREMDGRSAAGEGVYPLSRLGARTVPDSLSCPPSPVASPPLQPGRTWPLSCARTVRRGPGEPRRYP